MKIIKSRPITLAEAKELLEKRLKEWKPNEMRFFTYELQRDVYDYLTKFTKLDKESSLKLIKKLTEDMGIEEFYAIQIVNVFPQTLDELRSLLPRDRYYSRDELSKILKIIKESEE